MEQLFTCMYEINNRLFHATIKVVDEDVTLVKLPGAIDCENH